MKSVSFFLLLLLTLIHTTCHQQTVDQLLEEFQNPPSFTKPWVYWYWIDENISKEGITNDLEAMARVGIGKALIGHVSPGNKRGSVPMLSESWWEMVEHAVAEGGRVGVDIGFFNGPGWSQSGGPWIDQDHAMHYVVNKEIEINGPTLFRDIFTVNDSLFKPIALLAFPKPKTPNDLADFGQIGVTSKPEISSVDKLFDQDSSTTFLFPENLPGNELTIDVRLAQKVSVQSVQIDFLLVPFRADIVLQSIIDGQSGSVRQFTLDRRNINFEIGPMRFQPATFSLPITSSDHFQIIFKNMTKNPGAGLKEINLNPTQAIDQVIEKQLGKMYSDPLPPWDAYVWENEHTNSNEGIDPEQVVDLTNNLDSTGRLEWEIPEGKWILSLSGMVPTGAKNAPAPPDATGYECDKFSAEAVELHFNAFVGKFLQQVPPEKRIALKTVVIDSYEVGPQNWTADFPEIFMEKYGYDPIPWLPVFSGRIVKNADLSNRFLWDVRRLTSDLIANTYVKRLRELSNEQGLELWLENYGHWGFPGEFLQYGGQADQISGEFWFENPYWDLGPLECRAASSAAHTYGKTQVFAEAFTAGFNFLQYPAIMKPRGDRMFCEGINQLVHHVYIHQPCEDLKPGVTTWFGMSYNRNNIWFEQSKAWNDYLQRCHYLLQQGLPVSDVCYFIGEDAPKMTGILEPELPKGYDYDFINAEVIMNRLSVKEGQLILPDGKSYQLMVLPPLKTMRPKLLQKIRELLDAGANIYGSPRTHSPSLANYPEADNQVKSISDEIWGTPDEHAIIQKTIGKGKLFHGIPLKEVFDQISLPPDVMCEDTTIRWTHRSMNDTEIYFLSNQEHVPKSIDISFRTSGKVPELWYPDNGTMEKLALFDISEERTNLRIQMAPYSSMFVIFREPVTKKYVTSISENGHAINTVNLRDETPKLRYSPDGSILLQSGMEANYTVTLNDGGKKETAIMDIPGPTTIDGPWEVIFTDPWNGVTDTTFNELISWTDIPNIGFKYFSGTARYINTFELPESYMQSGQHIQLDLGKVHMMAEVILNGYNLGILWMKPWVADITGVVKSGENKLEILITNTWWNRLVGDEVYPHGFPGNSMDKPSSFTTTKAWNDKSGLLSSGLLGPVRIMVEKEMVL